MAHVASRIAFSCCVLLSLALGACGDAPAPRSLPAPGDLNGHVLAVLREYPTDGTHRYWWPKSGSWAGNVRTLRYEGRVLLEGDPEGRCYCCGLTFEVFLQAWERWCRETGRPYRVAAMDAADLLAFKDAWFGADGNRKTLFAALTKYGLGRRIGNLEDARPGDFVQLWRHSGSGHSVVFLAWTRTDGRITGLRYWSCQGATKGIGERVEQFGSDGSKVKRGEFYLCRVGMP